MDRVEIICVLLAAHWVADFVCQTSWQAQNKSKNWEALTSHVATYTLVLGAASMWFMTAKQWGAFVLLNFMAHFCIDAVTSRISSRLYLREEMHNFFVVVGFDQLLHQLTLIGTLVLVLRWP